MTPPNGADSYARIVSPNHKGPSADTGVLATPMLSRDQLPGSGVLRVVNIGGKKQGGA